MENNKIPAWLQTLWNVNPTIAKDAEKFIMTILPNSEQMEQAAWELGKESIGPDKETPDWMVADIKRGMDWVHDYINQKLNEGN